jgi:hypothetical protein
MTDTTRPTAEVLIRFYDESTTVDIKDGDRWVPAQLIPPAEPHYEFSAKAYEEALVDAGEAASWLVHLADVARGKVE